MSEIERSRVCLREAQAADLDTFAKRLQRAFAAGMQHAGLPEDSEPIPSDSDIRESFAAPGAHVLDITLDSRPVGGAVVTLSENRQNASLDLFFIDPEEQERGLGTASWWALEEYFRGTRTWETMTPYFDKRNIHFYVNKCGFSIVEFFHPGHPDPHDHQAQHLATVDPLPDAEPDLMFRLRKRRDAKQHAEP